MSPCNWRYNTLLPLLTLVDMNLDFHELHCMKTSVILMVTLMYILTYTVQYNRHCYTVFYTIVCYFGRISVVAACHSPASRDGATLGTGDMSSPFQSGNMSTRTSERSYWETFIFSQSSVARYLFQVVFLPSLYFLVFSLLPSLPPPPFPSISLRHATAPQIQLLAAEYGGVL